MKERDMQQALVTAILADLRWPEGSPVLEEKTGDLLSQIEVELGKTGLCAVVSEPDDLESIYGEATFNERSTWVISVFTHEALNATGLDNLAAAFLIRDILSNTNPGGFWSEPLVRARIRKIGLQDGVVARDVTFTAAYQS